jgi:hypothetical protein
MIEAVRPGNDIYSDTWAKAILSRDKDAPSTVSQSISSIHFQVCDLEQNLPPG